MGRSSRLLLLLLASGTLAGGPRSGLAGAAAAGATEEGTADHGSGCPVPPAVRPAGVAGWDSLRSFASRSAFFSGPGGAYVAENLLFYQNGDGGWPKNIDMTARTAPLNRESMIDNGATTAQIEYMAYMVGAFPECERYRTSFAKGMGWIFGAQYQASGGWPQSWPRPHDSYARRITYNDHAMVHVLEVLRDVVSGAVPYGFVDRETKTRSATALAKGVDCILKTQVVAGGRRTGWCAQHDEVTLLPAGARSYELPSISGNEGAGVLGFLMSLDLARSDLPRQQIVDAVEAAVLFYGTAPIRIMGWRESRQDTGAGPGDMVLLAAPGAGPLWARFYELAPPHRPFFCDRDGIKKYDVAEIGYERRNGYAWYGTWPKAILRDDYPKWAARWTPGRNVLAAAPAQLRALRSSGASSRSTLRKPSRSSPASHPPRRGCTSSG